MIFFFLPFVSSLLEDKEIALLNERINLDKTRLENLHSKRVEKIGEVHSKRAEKIEELHSKRVGKIEELHSKRVGKIEELHSRRVENKIAAIVDSFEDFGSDVKLAPFRV